MPWVLIFSPVTMWRPQLVRMHCISLPVCSVKWSAQGQGQGPPGFASVSAKPGALDSDFRSFQ